MHDSTQQPPTHPHPPQPPKALHYVNLLQEEPQQHFYNIHQNRGKACVWVVCDVLPAERLWSLNTTALALKARRERCSSEQLESKCWLLKITGGTAARVPESADAECNKRRRRLSSFGGTRRKKVKKKKSGLRNITAGNEVSRKLVADAERFQCDALCPGMLGLFSPPCAWTKAAHHIRRLSVNAVCRTTQRRRRLSGWKRHNVVFISWNDVSMTIQMFRNHYFTITWLVRGRMESRPWHSMPGWPSIRQQCSSDVRLFVAACQNK